MQRDKLFQKIINLKEKVQITPNQVHAKDRTVELGPSVINARRFMFQMTKQMLA
jgi:hypothetical protein